MTRAKVVIGANFGDEGKGLMTDYLSYNSARSPLNVLFNGGAQRGHTVVTPNVVEGMPTNFKHVFHHFGSGTLVGASTLLSHHFISNPVLFNREWLELADVGPQVFADPKGLMTTPYDMIINQIVEESRGNSRHGSCGMGINETIKRTENFLSVTLLDIDADELKDKLVAIRDNWVERRLAELGVPFDGLSDRWRKIIASEALVQNFGEDCRTFRKRVSLNDELELISENEGLIFEAGQGLLLDEDHRYFPNVTHSHTGLTNVTELLREAGIQDLQVYYMTRWYATRHGAGPFETEQSSAPTSKVVDETNIPNPFQGSLRFGLLDLDLLKESILTDLNRAKDFNVEPNVVLTCLDQAEEEIELKQGKVPTKDLLELFDFNGLRVSHTSHGPTRETLKDCKVAV